MSNNLQRAETAAEAPELGELFLLTNTEGETARCVLRGHWAGWELQLVVSGVPTSRKVCRSKAQVRATSERWKTSLLAGGWAEDMGCTEAVADE